MKKLLLLALAFVCCTSIYSQELMVHGAGNGLYLEHNVAAKEGLYSIGRNYNVNPKAIAGFNNIDLNGGLEIGQLIRIPLSAENFSQKTAKGVPVYYMPAAGEGLMKVSNTNGKVSLSNLRSWNKLSGDNIRAGEKLVVGYLVSKEYKPAAAAIASEQVAGREDNVTKTITENPAPEIVRTETARAIAETPADNKSKTVGNTAGTPDNAKSTGNEQQVSGNSTKPVETVHQTTGEPVNNTANNPTSAAREEPGNIKLSSENGFFKSFFDQQVLVSPISRNTTVTSGIFKTSSGWQDSKYYMLMDGVPTGTIIRIINPDNSKAIYAKVLGEMNGIRQNQGLGIRISNAAASALGIREEDKFIVRVNY